MRFLLLLLGIIMILTENLLSQGVAINTFGAAPHDCAALDIQSARKGILIPRMTTDDRNAIPDPQNGLLVYDSTTSSFWFRDKNIWIELTKGGGTNFWKGNGNDIYNMNAGFVGIGNLLPGSKLDVTGTIRSTGLIVNNGGDAFDFLMKKDVNGEVTHRKGHGAVAMRYIICLAGAWPYEAQLVTEPMLGEIKLWPGLNAPTGWAFCEGQMLSIAQNTSLFSIMGTIYGGNGQTTFALPDLRGATAVGSGPAPAGYQWIIGQKEN